MNRNRSNSRSSSQSSQRDSRQRDPPPEPSCRLFVGGIDPDVLVSDSGFPRRSERPLRTNRLPPRLLLQAAGGKRQLLLCPAFLPRRSRQRHPTMQWQKTWREGHLRQVQPTQAQEGRRRRTEEGRLLRLWRAERRRPRRKGQPGQLGRGPRRRQGKPRWFWRKQTKGAVEQGRPERRLPEEGEIRGSKRRFWSGKGRLPPT